MLRDALVNLMKNDSGGKCKLGRLIADLDRETSDLLLKALKSDIGTSPICRTLNNEGIKISREYLGQQRRQCFVSPEGAKRCCLNQEETRSTEES
jgi:hypothetical protein